MDDITVVGGGFSAFLVKVFIGNQVKLINCPLGFFTAATNLKRRRLLETNKLFISKAKSYGSLLFNLEKSNLHDRITPGGNSSVWGGMIDLSEIPNDVLEKLSREGVLLTPLSFLATGTISNKNNIGQLLDSKKEIFDAGKYIKKYDEFFMDSFFIEGNKIGLNLIQASNLKVTKVIYTEKLYICLGVVQTLDLLYRSGFLKEGDRISLAEYGHEISLKFTLLSSFFKKNCSTIVRFDLFRAASHFLGIQKRLFISRLFQFVPFYIDQTFSSSNYRQDYVLKDGVVSELTDNQKRVNRFFGKSIHYCDMHINGRNVNSFISDISKNINGVGMAFVKQKNPGPISNDIILDLKYKIDSN